MMTKFFCALLMVFTAAFLNPYRTLAPNGTVINPTVWVCEVPPFCSMVGCSLKCSLSILKTILTKVDIALIYNNLLTERHVVCLEQFFSVFLKKWAQFIYCRRLEVLNVDGIIWIYQASCKILFSLTFWPRQLWVVGINLSTSSDWAGRRSCLDVMIELF